MTELSPFWKKGKSEPMKTVRKDRHGGKYQNRIFLLLLLMAVVPLLIAGSISYKVYLDEVTRQTDLSMDAIEAQICNDVEVTLSSIRQFYREISTDDQMSWLKETRSIPYSDYSNLNEAQNLLKGPTYLDEYVGSYAFINIMQDWVLTNNGMYWLSEARNKEQVDALLEKAAQFSSTLFWMNNVGEKSAYVNGIYQSKTLDVSGFQMIMKLPGNVNRVDQIVMVQLNLPRLRQRLDSNLAGYELCIFSSDAKTVYSSDEVLENYFSAHPEELKNEKRIDNLKIEGGGEYRIRLSGTSGNGMNYVLAYNLGQMKEGAGRILGVSLVIMGALIVLLILSRIFTSILYQPVKSLNAYVSDIAGVDTEEMDEFSAIRENVVQLVDTKESLQLMVQNQQKILVEQFIIRTIRGEMTPEAVAGAQEQFQLPRARVYQLLTAVCMLEGETDQESELENEALSMTIVKKAPEGIAAGLITPVLCLNGQILLLTGANTQEELREKTMRIHTEFTEFVETEFGCSLISGVSQVFPGLKYLRTAYNECMETLKNTGSGPRDHSDITFYEEIARNDGIISGYDYVMENALTKAVNDGDCEEAAQLVDKFINSLNNRGITRHDRNFFLYRLVIAVLAVLSDAGLSANQVFRDRSEDIFQKLNYICESDKLKSYMNSQIVQPSIEALRQYRYQASSEILRRIMELVHERRGDITLTECAEQLNYHPSYIWKILKAERNMTFTDLVNLEKLETAKELLLNTELSIAEISEQLSYANTQNFIRFFSKYVDSTPGKYRKEHKGQEDKSRL